MSQKVRFKTFRALAVKAGFSIGGEVEPLDSRDKIDAVEYTSLGRTQSKLVAPLDGASASQSISPFLANVDVIHNVDLQHRLSGGTEEHSQNGKVKINVSTHPVFLPFDESHIAEAKLTFAGGATEGLYTITITFYQNVPFGFSTNPFEINTHQITNHDVLIVNVDSSSSTKTASYSLNFNNYENNTIHVVTSQFIHDAATYDCVMEFSIS